MPFPTHNLPTKEQVLLGWPELPHSIDAERIEPALRDARGARLVARFFVAIGFLAGGLSADLLSPAPRCGGVAFLER